jgi:hypothetical protein
LKRPSAFRGAGRAFALWTTPGERAPVHKPIEHEPGPTGATVDIFSGLSP